MPCIRHPHARRPLPACQAGWRAACQPGSLQSCRPGSMATWLPACQPGRAAAIREVARHVNVVDQLGSIKPEQPGGEVAPRERGRADRALLRAIAGSLLWLTWPSLARAPASSHPAGYGWRSETKHLEIFCLGQFRPLISLFALLFGSLSLSLST